MGANIHEAQYAHGKADFVSKLQIALKETNEMSYWLLLLSKANYVLPAEMTVWSHCAVNCASL